MTLTSATLLILRFHYICAINIKVGFFATLSILDDSAILCFLHYYAWLFLLYKRLYMRIFLKFLTFLLCHRHCLWQEHYCVF